MCRNIINISQSGGKLSFCCPSLGIVSRNGQTAPRYNSW